MEKDSSAKWGPTHGLYITPSCSHLFPTGMNLLSGGEDSLPPTLQLCLFPSDIIQPILACDPVEQMDHVFDSHVKTLCKADLEI